MTLIIIIIIIIMIFLRRGEKEQRQQQLYRHDDEYSFLVGIIREEGAVVSLMLLRMQMGVVLIMFSRKCLRFERGNITSSEGKEASGRRRCPPPWR